MYALVLALLFTLAVASIPSKLDEEVFSQFITEHNKKYAPEEYNYRLEVFSTNLKLAAALDSTSLQDGGANPARYGVTQFSDLTTEEFRQSYLLSNFSMRSRGRRVLNFTVNETLIQENFGLKNKDNIFDWKTKGKTTHVYNQGSCGSCWAFSVTEQHESMWAIHNGKNAESLSMQQLVDCDRPGSHGCAGGSPVSAWNYLLNAGGQDSYGSYPYAGQDQRCAFKRDAISAHFRRWGYVTSNRNEQEMKNYLLGVGPISVCVDASSWQHYRNGIVRNCGRSIDHCVQISGWDYSYNAWVVRNSWGTGWGVDGYIAIASGGDVCAIAQVPTTVEI